MVYCQRQYGFTVLELLFLEINFWVLQAAHETCRKFLYEENGERVIMVTDPPFGGLVEALASSFKKLMAMWNETEKEGMYCRQMGGLCCNTILRKKYLFINLWFLLLRWMWAHSCYDFWRWITIYLIYSLDIFTSVMPNSQHLS